MFTLLSIIPVDVAAWSVMCKGGFIFWVSDNKPHTKNKKSVDAGMEKMDFRLWNHRTDIMANCVPTMKKCTGTEKSKAKIKSLKQPLFWLNIQL